jgi:hypothetical protein
MAYTHEDAMADEYAAEQERWHLDPISKDRYRFDVVPLDLIDPSPLNPRLPRDAHIAALAASIDHHGQLVPGCAVEVGNRFSLLGGHHRRLALEIVAKTRGLAEPAFQLKILHPETTTARCLQVASELNASVKSLNFGEKSRHMVRVRDATTTLLAAKLGHAPTERELAEELGCVQGEDRMIFLLAPVIQDIRLRGAMKDWVDDHQHPVSSVRQRHDQQILTVKNLAYFLWPFVRQDLDAKTALPHPARLFEIENAVKFTDLLVERVLRPLWSQRASNLHEKAIDFVRHHPFRALASSLANSPHLFSGRQWPFWTRISNDDWTAIGTELNKAKTIDWGSSTIKQERSLAKLGVTISGMLYRARIEVTDADRR